MFGKRSSSDRRPDPLAGKESEAPEAGDMALDTLAGVLRSIAEFALEQESSTAEGFRKLAEAWAQHVLVAAPAPGAAEAVPGAEPVRRAEAAGGARRDWEGVRRFVREYCRSSSKHAASVTADLREVIWVFIRNFSQAFALNEETDERIQQQVTRLEKLVEASAASELKREVMDAIGSLTRAFEERRQRQRIQMASMGETVRALGDELESARREGETDPLTKVSNRKAFDSFVQRTVEMFKAFRRESCLLVVDVDHFKGINDTFGHVVGDQVLCEVANAIVKVFLRKSDFVARYGGDEFAVVLRETGLKDVLSLAERVRARVGALRIPAGDREITLTASIGAAAVALEDDATSWFERADRGLYAAKSAGRDRVAVGPDR